MAAPELDALVAQIAISKATMLQAMGIIDRQVIDPTVLANATADLKTVTDALIARNAAHNGTVPPAVATTASGA